MNEKLRIDAMEDAIAERLDEACGLWKSCTLGPALMEYSDAASLRYIAETDAWADAYRELLLEVMGITPAPGRGYNGNAEYKRLMEKVEALKEEYLEGNGPHVPDALRGVSVAMPPVAAFGRPNAFFCIPDAVPQIEGGALLGCVVLCDPDEKPVEGDMCLTVPSRQYSITDQQIAAPDESGHVSLGMMHEPEEARVLGKAVLVIPLRPFGSYTGNVITLKTN